MTEMAAVKRNPKRGMYVLPSLFTAGNIAAGYYAITQCVHATVLGGDATGFDHAALAIGFAVLFDGLDGRVARMTHTSSDFGREFDSLADVITFGVAPSILAFLWGVAPVMREGGNPVMLGKLHDFGMILCFLFLICGATRLARFNVSVNPQPGNPGRPGRKYFVGMPIPAGAGVISAVVHFEQGSPIHDWKMSILWLLLIAFTGFLMVSNWRFWSGKELNFTGAQPARGVLLMLVGLALVIWFSEYALIIMAMVYLLSGVLARLAYSLKRRSAAA
jgi:CDP-diacylglycerol--serine O-phosphatidyltransferase